MTLNDILWRNQGNILTPELILGIVHGVSSAQPPDLALINHNFPPLGYKGVTFGIERISEIVDEISPLHTAHWQESESFRHGLEWNPNYNRWAADEMAGRFLLFTVRDELGVLKGYCQVYISVSTHTGTKICNEDALYLHPDVRKGFICSQLTKYAESVLEQLGVREVRLSVKVTNDIWRLFERIGYQRTGYELVKVLKG